MANEPCKVLVIDDHRDSADSTVMLLGLWGHQAVAAYKADQAVALATSLDPDVVLMDLGLPGKDGFQLAEELRQLSPGCHIIALTGFTQADIVKRSADAGFNGLLTKPADPEELREVVDQHCDEARGRCEKS